VSFTGGQALAAVISVILALGLAFFFGAKAGFERGPDTEAVAAPRPVPAASAPASGESTSTVGTVPPATPSSSSAAAAAAPPAAGAVEEAPVFEDREAGSAEAPKSATIGPAPSTGPSRTEIAGVPAGAAPKASAPPAPAPSASKTEAQKKPPAEHPETSPAKAAPGKGGYYVQVLSTSSKPEAARWKERLAAKSYRTAAVTSVDSKKGKLYRVRTGPYADRAQAKKAAAKISAEFKQKAWVAPE
jgi:cell division septation protein DedD